MPGAPHRLFVIAGLLLFGAAPALAAEPNDPWPGLVQDIFNNRPMNDGSNVISVEMPVRAEEHDNEPHDFQSEFNNHDSRN